ncbi:MAG: TolC family protein [Comamonadaceae bacterium]|nr:MAG: TolC family protein [Comamonadaceae bacterium]
MSPYTVPFPRVGALAAALLLAGCASVSPDGLRSEVQAAVQGRTAGASAQLPSTDPAAQAKAAEAVRGWLTEPVTADAAVRIALLNNPGLQARLAQLGVQDADRVQALTLPNPRLALGRLTSGHEREIERTLSFGLVDLLALPWRARWQGQAMQEATLSAAQEVAQLAADARRAWLRAVAAEQILATQERMHEAADAGAELARRMARVGHWSGLQQAREQAVLADSRAQLAQASLAAATERENLARVMGLWGASQHLTLPDRLPPLPAEPLPAHDIEAHALRERLDVRAARSTLDRVADQQGTRAAANVFGDIGVAYSRNTTTERPSSGHADVQRGWSLDLPLPVFDWGGAASARAEALTRQSAAQLQHTALQARSEARTRWLAYRTAWDLAQQQAQHVVPLRQFIQQETLLRYNGMHASVWELLAEARSSAQAVAQAVQTQRDFWLADADLQYALTVGSPASAGAAFGGAAAAPSSSLSNTSTASH